MDLAYDTEQMQRTCLDTKVATKRHGAQIARTLTTRIGQLRAVDNLGQLVDTGQPGRWHELSGDLAGLVSAHLSANVRLLVTAGDDNPLLTTTRVLVVDIDDYY